MRLQAKRPLYVAEAERCRRPKLRGRWRRRSGADGPSSADGGFIAVGVGNTKSNKCRPRDPTDPYSFKEVAKGQATSSESKEACRVFSFCALRGGGTLSSRRARPHSLAPFAPYTHHSGSVVQCAPDVARIPDVILEPDARSSAAE